jgi:hypothetical protein
MSDFEWQWRLALFVKISYMSMWVSPDQKTEKKITSHILFYFHGFSKTILLSSNTLERSKKLKKKYPGGHWHIHIFFKLF